MLLILGAAGLGNTLYVPLWVALAYTVPPLVGAVFTAIMQWRVQRKQAAMEAYQKANHFETQSKLDSISANTNGKLAEIDQKLSASQAAVVELKQHVDFEKGKAEGQHLLEDRCKFIDQEGHCRYTPTGRGE